MSDSVKTFWSRPEGKTGMLFLAGAAVAVFWGWGTILPFIVSTLSNTLHALLLAGGIAALIGIAFSSRTHLLFRLAMRALTGLVIQIDPIGILKDRISQMQKRRDEMNEQISQVSGQIRFLKETISKNVSVAAQRMKEAAFAKDKAGSAQDAAAQLRMAAQMKVNANKAGRLQKANLSYQQLLSKLEAIYTLLSKWSVHVDAYIEDTTDEVKQAEIQYKTINSAYKAYKTAMRVIKGNATEEDIYNTTMEHLAEQAGQKLGEMEDFQRVAQSFMDNLDVQNGVVTEDALKMLETYEAKLLTPGTTDFLKTNMASQPNRAYATIDRNVVDADYAVLFNNQPKKLKE